MAKAVASKGRVGKRRVRVAPLCCAVLCCAVRVQVGWRPSFHVLLFERAFRWPQVFSYSPSQLCASMSSFSKVSKP